MSLDGGHRTTTPLSRREETPSYPIANPQPTYEPEGRRFESCRAHHPAFLSHRITALGTASVAVRPPAMVKKEVCGKEVSPAAVQAIRTRSQHPAPE